jgi:hypothetical protein
MDEIFGYFPPTANPPSKLPMLTLLKQARAFGLGCVLAPRTRWTSTTRAWSNCGTWLIGRLQTERDKLRVHRGPGGALAPGRPSDRADHGAAAGRPRQPCLPDAQCARRPAGAVPEPLGAVLPARPHDAAADQTAHPRALGVGVGIGIGIETHPAIPAISGPGASARGVPTAAGVAPGNSRIFPAGQESGRRLVYRGSVIGVSKLHFVDAKAALDLWQVELDPSPQTGAASSPVPTAATRKQSAEAWRKTLTAHLYQNVTLDLMSCPALKLTSKPGESEGDFRPAWPKPCARSGRRGHQAQNQISRPSCRP